jgi:hypothetical protein
MIPVPIPSYSFFILMGLGFLSLIGLLVWLGALIFLRRARAAFRRNLKKCVVLVVLLALLAGFFCMVVYQFWRVEYSMNFTLSQAQQIAGIEMPAGTRISTLRPHDPVLFDEAIFPVPTLLWGIQAIQVRRFLRYDMERDTYAPERAWVSSLEDQSVQGWRCSKEQPIEFEWSAPGEDAQASTTEQTGRFKACHLGTGNRMGPWPVPVGAHVQASEGVPGPDKTRGTDRWIVSVEPDQAAPMVWFGATLSSATFYLDAQRTLLTVSDGRLATDWQLGPITHRTGERVSSAPQQWQQKFPGALMFSPVHGQTASYQGHADVLFGYTAIQTPDGQVRAVVPNAEVGVVEFFTLE